MRIHESKYRSRRGRNVSMGDLVDIEGIARDASGEMYDGPEVSALMADARAFAEKRGAFDHGGGYRVNPRVRDLRHGIIDSWESARRFLDGASKRKLAHNTVVMADDDDGGDDVIAVVFHQTPIVRYHRDGIVEVRSGGWQTATTRERIRALLPFGFRLLQKRYHWFISDRAGRMYPFDGGVILNTYTGRVITDDDE